MSDIAIIKSETTEVSEKPVLVKEEPKFPPFPDPKDEDFDEDIPEEERNHYKVLFKDLNLVTTLKTHCTACDRHLGCSARNDNRLKTHPMLRTLVCQTCHTFYNSGEFEKGDDGSELYCRWCGQGGQVYCCADCPHVFCAKCIKRNLGVPKIKEIEELDDWKCFKCNNKCLWDLRALCWAVIRYCDLKNKITYEIEDPTLKEVCQKSCAQDYSECCKTKMKKKEKPEFKKKETRADDPSSAKKAAANVIYKIPPTIQVKKFASINIDESTKPEKKAVKRAASPKNKVLIKNPISITSKLINQLNMPPLPKKVRMPNSPVINPVRFNNDRKMTQGYSNYSRIRPKPPQMPVLYNGYNNPTFSNDNINLSLENLTQGLDMTAMAVLASTSQDDDVVCTPDFPMEPLCEVTEDNGDDDVQCITPGPVAAPKPQPPQVVIRPNNVLPDLNPENIIQMTDNDVTVNSTTGGLKFRVDPQTLSSNKMYRLPDGRIFAINANPNMPGGYSATIVAVTDSSLAKVPPKGTTFAAKLSAIPTQTSTPPPLKYSGRSQPSRGSKRNTPKSAKVNRSTETPARVCDLNVPIEWYRYNLVDAIDALEYSLSRLHQLKKDATTVHLRTRSVNEMRNLHRSLERSLNTSMNRFKEIRDNLNKEFKQYVVKKSSAASAHNSDDDDVEILPEEDNDDPIYIDENSMESNHNENPDVDLTVAGSSDFNDSSDKSFEKNVVRDPLNTEIETCLKDDDNDNESTNTLSDKKKEIQDNGHLDEENFSETDSKSKDDKVDNDKKDSFENERNYSVDNEKTRENNEISSEETQKENKENEVSRDETRKDNEINTEISTTDINGKPEGTDHPEPKKVDKLDEENILNDQLDEKHDNTDEKKTMDTEMSEEMIEDLLKDDNVVNDDEKMSSPSPVGNGDSTQNVHSLDVSDEIQDILSSEKD